MDTLEVWGRVAIELRFRKRREIARIYLINLFFIINVSRFFTFPPFVIIRVFQLTVIPAISQASVVETVEYRNQIFALIYTLCLENGVTMTPKRRLLTLILVSVVLVVKLSVVPKI